MKNKLRVLLILCLVLCLCVCGVVFVACNNTPSDPDTDKDDDTDTTKETVTYTITVEDEFGNPVVNGYNSLTNKEAKVQVQMCIIEENGELGACLIPSEVNENGVGTIEVSDTSVQYEIHVLNLPLGYSYEEGTYKTEANVTEYFVTLNLATGEESEANMIVPDELGFSITVPVTVNLMEGVSVYKTTLTEERPVVYYNFVATESGKYRVSSVADVDVKVVQYSGVSANSFYGTYSLGENDNVSDTDKNFSFEFVVTNEYVTGQSTCILAVSLADGVQAEYPVSFITKMERIGDAPRDPIETKETVEATSDVAAEEVRGSIVAIPVEGVETEVVAVLGDDGYYHLGSKDGDVIYVAFGVANRLILDGNFLAANLYGDLENINVPVPAGQPGSEFNDYTKYNYVPFVTTYIDLCNSDGMYPVNEEIKLFLERFTTYKSLVPSDKEVIAENSWLYPCYTYKANIDVADAEGEGTEASPYVLDEVTSYAVSLAANETVYIKVDVAATIVFTVEDSAIKATYNGEEYSTFTADGPFTFSFTSSSAAEFDFTLEYKEGTIHAPLIIGSGQNENITIGGGETVYYTFKDGTGTYSIYTGSNSKDAVLVWDGEEYTTANGFSKVVEMTENVVFGIKNPGTTTRKFTIIIEWGARNDQPVSGSGTQLNPYVLGGEGTYDVVLAWAEGVTVSVYYTLPSGSDWEISWTDNMRVAWLVCGEDVYRNSPATLSGGVTFSFDLKGSIGTSFTMTVTEVAASSDTPSSNQLVMGNNDVVITADDIRNNGGALYTFTTTEAGDYTFTITDTNATLSVFTDDYSLSGYTNCADMDGILTLTMPAGLTVNVSAGTYDWTAGSYSIEISYAVTPPKPVSVFLNDGENSVEYNDLGAECKYMPTASGDYTFTVSDETLDVVINGTTYHGTFTVSLGAWVNYTINIRDTEGVAGTCTVTVVKVEIPADELEGSGAADDPYIIPSDADSVRLQAVTDTAAYYTFTATEAGSYTFTWAGTSTMFYGSNTEEASSEMYTFNGLPGSTSYTAELEAGETIYFFTLPFENFTAEFSIAKA